MSFRIAIPSYKREKLLVRKTLAFLQSEGIPSEQIDIFVASREELGRYREVLGREYRLIVGVAGINKQREYMESYYPNGARVLFLDDDVRGIKTLYEGVPFEVLVECMFDIAAREGCKLWGVYPTDSGLCLQDRAVKGMTYIIGACYGMIISNFRPKYPSPTTEDFTRSILFHLHSGVIRFEGLGVQTKYFNPEGGLSEHRAAGTQEAEMRRLVARWPEHVRLRRRDGRQTDVQFRRTTREILNAPFTSAHSQS